MMASVFLCGTMYRKNSILEGKMERWESLDSVLQARTPASVHQLIVCEDAISR
jgi:hypothetical protein